MKKLVLVLIALASAQAFAQEKPKPWIVNCSQFTGHGLEFSFMVFQKENEPVKCESYTYDWHAYGKNSIESYYKKPCSIAYDETKKAYLITSEDPSFSGEIAAEASALKLTKVGGYTEGVDSFTYGGTINTGVEGKPSTGFECQFYKKP